MEQREMFRFVTYIPKVTVSVFFRHHRQDDNNFGLSALFQQVERLGYLRITR